MGEDSVKNTKIGCFGGLLIVALGLYVIFSLPSTLFSPEPFRMESGKFNYAVEERVDSVLIRRELGYIMDMTLIDKTTDGYTVEVDSSKKKDMVFTFDAKWVVQRVTDKSGENVLYP